MGRESEEEGLLDHIDDDRTSDASSVTAVVVFSTFVAACGSLVYGFAVGYSSPAESDIMEELGLSISDYSTFGSILTFGGLLGALISGRVADFIGRKGTMWLSEIFFILGWIGIVFAKSAWWLDIARLSLGVGAGLHCYVAPIYVAEITPKNIRGAFTAAATFAVTCSFALMFYLGNFIAWRMLALIGTIPCLVPVVGLFFIPESPRWLAKVGRGKEVEASLQRLRGRFVDISLEAVEIKDYTEYIQQLPESQFVDLFSQRYAHSLVVGVGLMLLIQFGGINGISSFASSIFTAAGSSATFATTVIAVIQLPFAILGVLLMDKSGRRPLLMVTSGGACLGCFLTGLGFLLKEQHGKLTAILVQTGILVYSACVTMGMGGTPWVIMSEIFPINIKGLGGTLVTLSNWFSSWIVTYAFNFFFEWSTGGVASLFLPPRPVVFHVEVLMRSCVLGLFLVFAIVCGSTMLFVVKLVPETKGQSLEEIQEKMTLFGYMHEASGRVQQINI